MVNILNRKDSLIISTIDLIDELGIQGLSTRRIAKKEGVSEATLFRHYVNKNDLLAAVLDYYSRFDAYIYQAIKLKGLKPKEAIIFYVNSYAEYYENNPAMISLMLVLYDLRYEHDLTDKVKSIIKNHYGFIRNLVEEAQSNGELVPVNAENLSEIISGLFQETCLTWKLEDIKFSLKERVISSLNILIDALSLSDILV